MAPAINTQYDIIVIGSGPAGIASALFSLQKGKRTLLIAENPKEPSGYHTVESIHPGVISLLTQLNISADFPGAILGSYHFISDGKNMVSLNPYSEERWTGFHISKYIFTNHLLMQAKMQGLEILTGDPVSGLIMDQKRLIGVSTKTGQDIYAAFVIDASGNKRLLGKKLGFYEKFYSPSLVTYTGRSDSMKENLHDKNTSYFLPNKNGWTWQAKLEDQSFYWTRLMTKKAARDAIARDDLLNLTGTAITKTANMRWRIFRPLCIEGGILCGDAACLIDPAAGQGILNALSSGIKAGDAAVACINNTDYENIILAGYDNWVFTRFEQNVSTLKGHYKNQGIEVL